MAELPQAKEPSAKARRFQAVLDEYAPGARVVEFDRSSRTAREAAAAIGCTLNQIVKSLMFRDGQDRPVLVLTAGGNRVNEARIDAQIDTRLVMADAAFTRAHTGYAIGGVPPFGHAHPVQTLIDEGLLAFDEVWAAAGTPKSVFPIDPNRLVEITTARRVRVG